MKETKVTPKLTLRHVGAFFALSAFPALAQSGHTINSIDTRSGTSAPANPMMPTDMSKSHPTDHPLINGGKVMKSTSHVDATSDLSKDARSSTSERRAARNSKYMRGSKLNKINRGNELPNTNGQPAQLPDMQPIPK